MLSSRQSGPPLFGRLVVIGLGLIGGSFAKGLRERGLFFEVVGVDLDAQSCQLAVQQGVVDRCESDLAKACQGADVIQLAVPILAMEKLLGQLAQLDLGDAVLTDVGSAKGSVVRAARRVLEGRRLLRDGIIPSFWLPPTLSIAEQLALVFREFNLTLRGPRCMSCGGELHPGDKEALRERIPPRTYRWRDDYFVCARCDKLFWHGTHWRRIVGALAALQR